MALKNTGKKKMLLIAEKPDLMRKIEKCYRAHKDQIPYEIDFVSQRGHLVTLKNPDELDEALKEWSWDTLPILPKDHGGWQYKVIKEKKVGNFKTPQERYDEIRTALKSGKYDAVIDGADPDREGQLLVYLVLAHCRNKLPILRFWTNDLTDGHILNALLNLRDDEKDEQLVNLRKEAYGRQHADYLFGMNASRAATLKMNIRVACGRVKTVILAIVCKREDEIAGFRPETVYGVKVKYKEGFDGTLVASGKIPDAEEDEDEAEDTLKGVLWFRDRKEAQAVIDAVTGSDAVVEEYAGKRQKTYAPKFFKLASAQIEAGKMGYSAADTLRIIQGLYEKKFMSYPRTGCEYLGGDEDIEAMLKAASAVPQLKKFVDRIGKEDIQRVKGSKTWINPKALQDEGHSALVPTTAVPDWDELEDEEKDIYAMICRQFIAPFLPPLVQDRAELTAKCGGYTFKSTGKTLVDPGWTAVFDRKFTDMQIPVHKKGDVLGTDSFSVTEKTSVCPKRYTTADLVAVCENPMKFLNDKSLKKLGKKLKIGTPATRAGIIEELVVKDKYLKKTKEGRREVVIPTTTGKEIIDNIGDCDICKVDLTGEWEQKLEEIRGGKLSLEDFEKEMEQHVARLVEDFKHRDMKPITPVTGGFKQIGTCPGCGGTLMQGPTRYYCTGYKKGCTAGGFRERKGAVITEDEFLRMLNGEKIEKEMEDNGRRWKQTVACDPKTLKIIFPVEKKETPYRCPLCGKKIIETPKSYYCEAYGETGCGFRVSKTLSGKEIEKEQLVRLFTEGSTGLIEGLYSEKQKKYYNVRLAADKENNKVIARYSDVEKPTAYKCPVCGKALVEKGLRYICSCGFKMYNTQAKKKIPDKQVKKMLAAVKDGLVGGKEKAYITDGDIPTGLACPCCKKEIMRENLRYHCADKDGCGFSFYRIMADHIISDKEVKDILTNGKSGVIKDFVSQKGENFPAKIAVDKEEKKLSFDFDTAEKSKYNCPICGEPMMEDSRKLSCECGMQIWKTQGKRPLTEKDLKSLIEEGETKPLRMKRKDGTEFTARIVIDREERRTTFG
jgi:DNA topoisomerase-3